ncbi:MAG: hypothetical protein ACOYMB_04560 [Patescibacteria group bacterium]
MIFGRKKKNNGGNLEAFLNQKVSSGLPEDPEAKPEESSSSTEETKPEQEKGNFFSRKASSNLPVKNNFHNPQILQFDLVKQELEGQINWRRYINLLIATVLMSSMIVAQIYFIISWWGENDVKSENISKNSEKAQEEIKNFQKSSDEALAFSKRAELISPLLDQHIYWTNFFRYLERNTLSSVYFSGFSGDASGEYNLQAQARHYSDINWQVKKFLSDDYTISATVSEGDSGDGTKGESALGAPVPSSTEVIKVDEAMRLEEERNLRILGPQSVSFSIKLKVKPDIFYLQKTDGKP